MTLTKALEGGFPGIGLPLMMLPQRLVATWKTQGII